MVTEGGPKGWCVIWQFADGKRQVADDYVSYQAAAADIAAWWTVDLEAVPVRATVAQASTLSLDEIVAWEEDWNR